SFGGVSIVDCAVPLSTFAARHAYNSTSPASSFARTVTAQRRHAGGSSVLRGCLWTRTDQAAVTIESLADWRTLLADEFDVVPDVSPRRLRTLWTSVRSAHETWLATA
ncbi:MAG: acetyltransferase, partial [bacterium]